MAALRRCALFVLVTSLTAAACASAAPDGGLSLPPLDGGVTVPEALESESPSGWIRGFILAVRGEPVRICESLAESFPPQCGGASLILREGVLWREPYPDGSDGNETTPGGSITDGVLATDEPCGHEPEGPCTGMVGVKAGNGVWWTEVEYSVIGTIRGDELRGLEAPPGADL